ncbi:hypothetical protein A3C26_01320 [Candidatus Daviesbacteria bacterium RIFCSPHIGHO2_02_FULL_39_12]|uniref:Diaminopimelate epimerase n=1 Tax=Candidatus Daviesbacteria bacterium RIFCSPHIGHO2_02_FULL_39_12 TaxID=1797770 RepID=A0A1F5JC53_9BACT|nr:MAG: hypothetical protein A3C26_01320 [Candidatus Daviesbacteria bacterium RIFCSPHIGHO2_02_FULL_39_12]
MLDYSLYQACQNKFLIFELKENLDWQNNRNLRNTFTRLGKKNNVDSVLVLKGNPRRFYQQGYHYEMYVFEPKGGSNNGLAGGISTMCGNGVRAVAAFIQKQFPDTVEARIMTLSGLRTVEIDGSLYTVHMGEFTYHAEDLSKYVNTTLVLSNKDGNFLDSPIPESILKDLSRFTNSTTWSIGLNGNREGKSIDGEPHVVLEVPGNQGDIEQLRKLAVETGPIITKNLTCFPKEINANFIFIGKENGESVEIMNCTHERNLGNDAYHSVTPACGTGSTVAGGFMLERYPRARSVLVHCTGGDLIISKSRSGQELLLKGPAEEVK